MPTREKMVRRASATEMGSIFFRDRASGKPIEKSIRVRIYLCLAEEGGETGPTR